MLFCIAILIFIVNCPFIFNIYCVIQHYLFKFIAQPLTIFRMDSSDKIREIMNLRSTIRDMESELEIISQRHSELIESKNVVINELQAEIDSFGILLASKDEEIASLKSSASLETGMQDESELSTLRSACKLLEAENKRLNQDLASYAVVNEICNNEKKISDERAQIVAYTLRTRSVSRVDLADKVSVDFKAIEDDNTLSLEAQLRRYEELRKMYEKLRNDSLTKPVEGGALVDEDKIKNLCATFVSKHETKIQVGAKHPKITADEVIRKATGLCDKLRALKASCRANEGTDLWMDKEIQVTLRTRLKANHAEPRFDCVLTEASINLTDPTNLLYTHSPTSEAAGEMVNEPANRGAKRQLDI